jgi:hypothetical protein
MIATVLPERPVYSFHGDTQRLCQVFERIGSLGRIFDTADALVGEITKYNIGCHDKPPLEDLDRNT